MLQKAIGSGGSGLVYRAWNSNLGQQVCIKIFYPLKPDLTNIVATISRGIRGIAKLNHYNIVKIFDFAPFELEGKASFYIVMEWIDGKTLDDWSNELPDSHQSLVKRLKMAFKIAMALKDAHNFEYSDEVGFQQTGVLHGDIKPANIMVRLDASPVLIDFMMIDVQRLIDPKVVPSYLLNKSVRAREMTAAMGTPGFMAPEQEEEGIVTRKTDIFSLGITFCYLFFPENPRLIFWTQEIKDQLHDLKSLLREMTDPKSEKRPRDMKVVIKRIAEIATVMGINLSTTRNTQSKHKNPWLLISFYFTLIVLSATLFLIIKQKANLLVLIPVIFALLLIVSIVGAFQLRKDRSFRQNNFFELMFITLQNLPFFWRKDNRW